MMVMWAPPDDDVIVREYVIGWGESGPYEHVAKTEASQRYYHITELSKFYQKNVWCCDYKMVRMNGKSY